MSNGTEILFPVGRVVQGSMSKPQTTDAEGKPLVIKSGPNAGQSRVDYFFAVAIPKKGEAAWWDTEWGQKIVAAASAAFPNAPWNQGRQFSWKVKDGDSQQPNSKGKRPCDQEGFKGNWIVYFSSGFAPKTYSADGSQPIDPETIKPGHFVEVLGTVNGNGSQNQPGVFINHSLIAHAGYGPEIHFGPDAGSVGFGSSGERPAGMTDAPPSSMAQPGAAPAASGPGAGSPGTTAAPPTPAGPGAAPAAAPTPVAPYAGARTAPAAPAAPGAAPAAPAAPAARQMTAAAITTYDEYIKSGWTDELLIAHGLMTA